MPSDRLYKSMTERVFPEIDSMLQDVHYYRSTQFIKQRVNGPAYRSPTDLLFCELSPEFKDRCRKYYKGRGAELSKQLTDVERAAHVYNMKEALIQALLAMREKDKKTWREIKKIVDERITMMKEKTQ